MGRNLYKLINNFDDVSVMLILWRHQNATAKKDRRFSRVFAEYLQTVQLIITYVIFRQSSIVAFEIKSENRSLTVAMVTT